MLHGGDARAAQRLLWCLRASELARYGTVPISHSIASTVSTIALRSLAGCQRQRARLLGKYVSRHLPLARVHIAMNECGCSTYDQKTYELRKKTGYG